MVDNANRIVGTWQCPPHGKLPGGAEQGPTQIIMEFDASGLATMRQNITEPSGDEGTWVDRGTYRISPVAGNILSTDLLGRGEPVRFEFENGHLILMVPNEDGTRDPSGRMEFARVKNEERSRGTKNEMGGRKGVGGGS
jgi:hypothetical protein